jgi:hypothetical protein
MAQQWLQWLNAWEGFGMQAEEIRELDDERVLVLHRYSGRGKSSGMELDEVQAKAAMVLHVREGKVTCLVGYNDRDRARAAAERLAEEQGQAVSEENVEIVSRGWEHFVATGELLENVFSPDFVLDLTHARGWPEQRACGASGGRRRSSRSSWRSCPRGRSPRA